ncbi:MULTISPECIES: hypothetical protein [Streptomyces]|uniref:Integral membrane protein n=1 Tax=Streptomyces chilikensis TaxID=1194079 RepID=A0ABV3EVH3_9ACTN|nr:MULTISPECIES: hypothetical protein [Streptomyces]MDH6225941.1 hypothetical protein [Streptomyces sp. MJP52]
MSATFITTLGRSNEPVTLLRRFLALDAVVTTANGVAYLAASGPLGRLLGVDSGLLLGLGAFLVLFGAGVGFLGTRRLPPVLAVKGVVEANLVWAVASLVALFAWFDATAAGAVWIPAQALTVAGFAALQHMALRAAED